MADTPSREHHSLWTGRRSSSGQYHLVTTVAWHRQPVFRQPAIAHPAARALADPDLWQPGQCLCWVLMPDRWHGLIMLRDNQDLSTTIQRAKKRSSRHVHQLAPLLHPLWQESFHHHALRYGESITAAIRYIIANPLHAGLVRRALDYPYWGALWLEHASHAGGA